MSEGKKKLPRGRPKTFDRERVIETAMQAYWQRGQSEVSLNEVCRLAEVSKPTIYKEFGSEDGLKQTVLRDYHKMTLAPLYEILEQNQPFDTAMNALTDHILRDHQDFGMPNGCLFVDMCQCHEQLGELTRAQVDEFKNLSLSVFENWINSAQSNGQLRSQVVPRTAALYIDAQIATIMNLQRQGASNSDTSAVFRLALSVFD